MKTSKHVKTQQIATLLISGYSVEETANKTGKSTRTIQRHLKKNIEKLKFLGNLNTHPSVLYSKKLVNVMEHLDNLTTLILNMEENLLVDKYNSTLPNELIGRKARKERKVLVFKHYCGSDIKCACCGERKVELLTLDHVNEDGKQHRDEINTSSVYEHLLKINFKTTYEFQVLCYNCNLGKYRNGGICPHKET